MVVVGAWVVVVVVDEGVDVVVLVIGGVETVDVVDVEVATIGRKSDTVSQKCNPFFSCIVKTYIWWVFFLTILAV